MSVCLSSVADHHAQACVLLAEGRSRSSLQQAALRGAAFSCQLVVCAGAVLLGLRRVCAFVWSGTAALLGAVDDL